MAEIQAELLTAEAFAPFGEVLASAHDSATPLNDRASARAVIEVVAATPATASDRHLVAVMERHSHSTQAFLPLDGRPYLVVVAPTAPDGSPDLSGLAAFAVPGRTGVQYRRAVWHAPITALGPSGRLATVVHKDGSAADCEFRDVPPIGIRLDAVSATALSSSTV